MKKLFKTTSTVKQSVFTGVAFSLLLTPFHATLAQDDVEDDVDGIEAQLVEETVEAEYDDYEDDDESSIDEVVVTVERRAVSLQDFAGTAVSFTGEELALQGLQNITDLSESVVGLEIGNERGNVSVWIRGVGSDNNTELGDPAAATHIDGVYIPRPRGIGGAFFDLERVEVNVGPQGTIRGRNAMAGSINAISWNPGREWVVATETEIGNYGTQVYQATINAPLTETTAMRLALLKRDSDSYYNDVSPENRPGPEAANDFAGRLKFLWEPNDRLSFLLAGDLLTERGTGYTGTNFANPLGNGISADLIDDPRDAWLRGITPLQETKHWGGKFQIDYHMDHGSIEFLYGHRDLVYSYQASTPLTPDYPGVVESLGGPNVGEALDNFSRFQDLTDSKSDIVELRYYTPVENTFYFSTGLFYFNEDQYSFLGATGDGDTFFNGIEFNQPDTDTESFAVYFDGTYQFSDRTRATAGIRFTDEKKSRRGVNASYRIGGVGIDGNGNPAGGLGFRFGTEGFKFAVQGRTIFDPDTDGDGLVSETEYYEFLLDGIDSFGDRDNLDDAIANEFAGQPTACVDTRLDDDLFCPAGGDFIAVFPFSPLTSVTPQRGRISYSFVDWRLRLEHNLTDDNLVYFLIATGHKSGLFNDTFTVPLFDNPDFGVVPGAPEFLPTTNESLATAVSRVNGVGGQKVETDPERVTNFELGTKNEFDLTDDIAARVNATLFYQDYRNQIFCNVKSVAQNLGEQLNTGGGSVENTTNLGVNFCFNTKRNEIFGSQLETALFLPNEFTLKVNALWLESYFRESPTTFDSRFDPDIDGANAAEVSLGGNRLPRSPRYSLNISLSQVVDLPLGSLDYLIAASWRDEQHMTVFNGRIYGELPEDDNPLRLDDLVEAYWTYDVGAGFSFADSNFRLEGFINNITDEVRPVAIGIRQTDNTRFFTRPRTYGLRLKWQL